MLTFLDLFSGIGGFRLGMEMAGHKCLGHCEIDKFANKSYIAMHNPKEDEWYADDITRVRAGDMPVADCWCFGFPCQDISVAGKQGGFKSGKRSSLLFAVTGLIRNLEEKDKPSILFIENVKNLLSINRGFDFLQVLIELDEIGYDAEWQVINSAWYVPQNRERVFIIGHLRGRGGRKVFPVKEKNRSAIKRPEIADTAVIGGIYVNSSKKFQHGILSGMSRCLKANKNDAGIVIHQKNKIAIPVINPDRINKNQNGRRFKNNNDPMFTLTTQDRHGVLIFQGDKNGNAHCIDANYYKGLCANQKRTGVCDGAKIRRLTPRECFRLQGFPDEYFARAQAVNSDTQLYKQAGNSVTVPVIYNIAKNFKGGQQRK